MFTEHLLCAGTLLGTGDMALSMAESPALTEVMLRGVTQTVNKIIPDNPGFRNLNGGGVVTRRGRV